MGTSNSNPGPSGSTPLVPTWVDDPVPTLDDAIPDTPPLDGAPPPAPPDRLELAAPSDPQRFASSRGNLTRFAGSNGTDRRSLGRAMSQYVSGASGGTRQAARRMGASRQVAERLLGLMVDARIRGADAALRTLNLQTLAGRPIEEVFSALMDQVCPDGGSIDEGIARAAFVETLVDLEKAGIQDLDTLSAEQIETVLELYITHSIEARICNAIGMSMVAMPADPGAAASVEAAVRDFIARGVRDAIYELRGEIAGLTQASIKEFVDRVYRSAFEFIKALGDSEAEE